MTETPDDIAKTAHQITEMCATWLLLDERKELSEAIANALLAERQRSKIDEIEIDDGQMTDYGEGPMTTDRVDFTDKRTLYEIVSTAGAHLERIGTNRWFLTFRHADGSETALWFSSRDLVRPFWERREPAKRTQEAMEKEE